LIAEFQSQRSLGLFSEDQLAALLIFKEQPAAFEVLTLVTHPDFRGRGYMKRLLETLQSQVSINRDGSQEIWLEVHTENISARNLYEKMGFTVTAVRPRYYRDGKGAYAMIWKPEKAF
jgi:ribosomal-protein-alanine N-acetyltransferase